MLAERFPQNRRAEIVDAGVLGDLVHALADADQRDEVNHCVDAVERARERVGIADVADDQFNVGGQVIGPSPFLARALVGPDYRERAPGVRVTATLLQRARL